MRTYNRRRFSAKEIEHLRRQFRAAKGSRGDAKKRLATAYGVSLHRIHKELVRCGEIRGRPRKVVSWTQRELTQLRKRYDRRFDPAGEGESVVKNVALEKGCSIDSVYLRLRSMGLDPTRERPAALHKRVIDRYLKTRNSVLVGKQFGYPPATVIRWANEANIDTRKGFHWTKRDDDLLRREIRRMTDAQLVQRIGRGVTLHMVRNRRRKLQIEAPDRNFEKRKYVLHELPRPLATRETRIYVMLGRKKSAYVGGTKTELRVRVKNHLNSQHGRAKNLWAIGEQDAGRLVTVEVLQVPDSVALLAEHAVANALVLRGYRLLNRLRRPAEGGEALVAEALRVLGNPPAGRFCSISPPPTETIYVVEHDGEPRYVGRTRRKLSDRLDSHLSAARAGSTNRLSCWLRKRNHSRAGLSIRALQSIDAAHAQECEAAWIERFRKTSRQLLNEKSNRTREQGPPN